MSSGSLKDLWEHAENIQKQGNPQRFQELVTEYAQCLDLVHKLSLFSNNEDLEEVKTNELKFMLVPFKYAKVLQDWSREERLGYLKQAENLYQYFLQLCEDYKIVSPKASVPKDAAFTRQAKIEHYKQKKQLNAQIRSLESSLSTSDEEDVREYWLTVLKMAVEDTYDNLESLQLEVSLLQSRPQPGEQKRLEERDERDKERLEKKEKASDWKLDDLSKFTGLLDKTGKPLRPFTILPDRKQQAKGVFRPDYNLPTMTLDEYIDEEMRRGNIISQNDNKGETNDQEEEDTDEKADAKTMKARRWDEFVEANPRGIGNTKMNRG
ncbi:TAP42 family protein [Schizosaccharomyces japonicus yFS275]|uniref:TAP42 family protein n=1 Tax=Schizosaccharomyces japonicus (strain yFS275 / FY16936) TaxID=402676 RepID=B6K6A7_SCHJY|nr:TAP42 family protein [Schizosaccharomyces japonicus yFS275]EEB09061.1 TAP42 family protein [Schizosaccharomyces japonicus yFS275]